jgi:hypothetical protein
VVFGALGILVMSHDGEPSYFMVVMGGLFVVYGLSQFFTAKRYSAK